MGSAFLSAPPAPSHTHTHTPILPQDVGSAWPGPLGDLDPLGKEQRLPTVGPGKLKSWALLGLARLSVH